MIRNRRERNRWQRGTNRSEYKSRLIAHEGGGGQERKTDGSGYRGVV